MASKPKSPMPISERAKQFLPFAAVKGLPEALAKKEKVAALKVEMTEELAIELDEKIQRAQLGATVSVTYFFIDQYIQLTGQLVKLDSIYRTIQIDETIIEIDDISDLDCDEIK